MIVMNVLSGLLPELRNASAAVQWSVCVCVCVCVCGSLLTANTAGLIRSV